MASGGTWDPISLPVRPGLYLNFVEAALAAIAGGPRGIVGIPIYEYTGGTAEAGKFYTIEEEADAVELFGANNAKQVLRILQGGAAEVLAFAVPDLQTYDGVDEAEKEIAQYIDIRDQFEARLFNVFVYPSAIPPLEQDATVAWTDRNREEGKHFLFVLGGTADEDKDSTVGNARSVRCKHDYVVNLINGVVDSAGNEIASGDYAPFIAGLIAGTAINKSITYAELPVADVNKHLKNSEIIEALTSGSLVLVNDGKKIKIEQGVVTASDSTKRGKIRIMRARQAVATDIPTTARDRYIGKIDNNPAGQATLIAAIKAYLETLELNNVIMEPEVVLDPNRPSVGDCVFLAVAYTEVDSMERIFLTINV